jgi:CRP-like cAMP-binding protein
MAKATNDFTATTQFAGLSGAEPAASEPAHTASWLTLPLFAGMDGEARARFSAAMKPAAYAASETIIAQGEDGEEMFVLAAGTIRITVRNAEDVVVFERTSEAPAIFGEMSLITREPRSATITAESPCDCLRIDKAAVKDLFARHPSTAVFLTRLVGERLMQVQGIRKVGKYEVIGRLGAGGVATVFEARHPSLGIPVALKMLSHALVFDPGFADHFAEEARLVAMLDHENIVRVLDTEQAYGTHFIVMEKLTGELLDELIESGQAIPWGAARRILREICDALAYSHERGFIHRDVKPENVFLRGDGRVKLMDFGIATRSGGGSRDGRVFGTPYYMSPEQIDGSPVDHRADLYAFGVILYRMFTGRLPFQDGNIFVAHALEPVPDPLRFNPELPREIVELLLRCLAKRPEDRPDNAGSIKIALQDALFAGMRSGTTTP